MHNLNIRYLQAQQEDDAEDTNQINNDANDGPTDLNPSLFRRILACITLEPLACIHLLAIGIKNATTESMINGQLCNRETNYNDTQCMNLGNNQTLRTRLYEGTQLLASMNSLLEVALSVIVAMFVIPWADRCGRKTPILCSVIGSTVSTFILLAISCVNGSRPEVTLVPSFISGASGSTILLMACVFSYISFITSKDVRTFRMGIVNGCWFAGGSVGVYFSDYLISKGGYRLSYVCCLCLMLVGLIYTFLRFRKLEDSNCKLERQSCMSYPFSNLYVLVRNRAHRNRAYIMTLFVIFGVYMYNFNGLGIIQSRYAKEKFNWTDLEFNKWKMITVIVGMFGQIFMMGVLCRRLNISDFLVGALGSSADTLAEVFQGVVAKGKLTYVGSAIGAFGNMTPIIVQSVVSKLVNKNELGSWFLMVAICQSSMTIVSRLTYLGLYQETLDSFSGTMYCVSAVLQFITFIIFMIIYYDRERSGDEYEEPLNANVEVQESRTSSLLYQHQET